MIVGVRPEHTRLWDAEPGLLGPLEGRVEYVESLGRETLIAVEAHGGTRFVVEAEGNVRAEAGRGGALRAAPRLGLPLRRRRRARARSHLRERRGHDAINGS